jgi:hypothetical protein
MEFAKKLQERTGKGYLSYSALKYAADNSKQQDMKLFELYMRGLLKKDSPALSFGSLYDCMLLEPEKVDERFLVLDDTEICAEIGGKNPRATKKYKEWKAEQDTSDKRIVSESDMTMAIDMINRLDASEVVDPTTGELVPVRKYLSGNAQHEINNWIGEIPVRGFLDVMGDGFITDSKSTRSIHGFRYDVNSFCYDIQAYIYTQVMGTNDFYWVVQEKTKPYLCGVYKATDKTLASGERKFWSAIENVSRWLDAPEKDTNTFALYGEI